MARRQGDGVGEAEESWHWTSKGEMVSFGHAWILICFENSLGEIKEASTST